MTFYYFCLVVLLGAVAVGRNYRRSRAGRAAIAVRDNARGAASFGISPLRTKLAAFALSGALAGVAGGLYVVGLRGIGFSGYNPENSLQVFTMAVVGGLGSLAGGLIGAFYVEGAQYFLHGAAQLLATGGGILLVVLLLPGGLAELVYRARDATLRRLARRRDIVVPGLAPSGTDTGSAPPAASASRHAPAGMLVLSGVSAGYGPVQVLFGVDLAVRGGEIVGLLGTNGAGKSTVLRVVSGLLPMEEGTLVFEGEDLARVDAVGRVRRGLAMAPGGRGVFPSLTVGENLRLAGWLSRRDQEFLAATADRVFDLFPVLKRRLATPARLLSGGEQQMLTIAQALYCRPKLLLIDELSLGLAPALISQLLAAIRALAADGLTVVIVEQSLNLASSIAQRAVFMERGQVRFAGLTAELAERRELVRSVFLAPHDGSPDSGAGNGRRGAAHRRRKASTRSEPVFEVRDLTVRFGGITALDGVGLRVARGEILGVIGANGAGKTTLFDVCSGFTQPTSGHVLFRGADVTRYRAHDRADLGLGRVFQDARLFPSLTVAETLAAALERHLDVRDPFLSLLRTEAVVRSEAEAAATVEEVIARMGLEAYRDSLVSELSTGTRRIVEIGCVLAHDPTLLLLDEPSSGIAQREGEALAQLLVELRDQTGSTLVVIEHDVPLVSSISDRMLCMHLGTVISDGSPERVLEDPAVIEAYLGMDEAAIGRSDPTGVSGSGRSRRSRSAKEVTGAS